MANNNALFNGAFQGALNGLASRWLTNTNAASYDAQRDLCIEFATAFDDRIATIADPGATQPEADLAESICGAFWRGRILTESTDVDAAADALVAVWTSAKGSLLPVSSGTAIDAVSATGIAVVDDGNPVEVLSITAEGAAIALVALTVDPDDPGDTPSGSVSITDPDLNVSTIVFGPISAGDSVYVPFSAPGTGDGDWSIEVIIESATGPCTVNAASFVLVPESV